METAGPGGGESLILYICVRQAFLWCRRCGGEGKLKKGLLPRLLLPEMRSRRYFARLRPRVIARDSSACRVCGRPGSGKRIHVHHRWPGVSNSKEGFLISLCPFHHAMVHRLTVFDRILPAFLLERWREQHPALGSSWPSILSGLATPATFTPANYGRFRLSELALIRAEATSSEEELSALVLNGVTSSHTRRSYQTALEQFVAWLGTKPRQHFSKALVQEYRAHLLERKLSPLRKLAREMSENGLCPFLQELWSYPTSPQTMIPY